MLGDQLRILTSDDSCSYGWDDTGRMTRRRWDPPFGEKDTLEYSIDGQLLKISNTTTGVIVEYDYDGVGNRIRRHGRPTTTIKYTHDGADLLFEHDNTDEVQIRYLYGPGIDHILESEVSGSVYQHFADALGSVTLITDSAGDTVKTMTYDSFGNIVDASGSASADHVSYTSREWDDEFGIYYYRARYYDPLTGRFMIRDALGFAAGDVNLYRYVGNNPVNFTDAMGLKIDWNNKYPSNPLVRKNLIRLNEGIIAQGYSDDSFTIFVTTADRYSDRFGRHIGLDTGNWIRDSRLDSPHLLSRGARAVDFHLLGLNISYGEQRRMVNCALKSHTEFLPENTRPENLDGKTPVYAKGKHIHIALPYKAPFILPYYGPYNLPEKPIEWYFRDKMR